MYSPRKPHSIAENTPQTQSGAYSNRLSDQSESGHHESFRLDENFFRQVIESLEDYAVFTTDTQGLVSSWNGAAQCLLGYTEKEIIGQRAALIFTPADREAGIPEQELKTAAEQARALDERFHVRKDGSTFWASGLVFPLTDEDGALRGFTKILRDMTKAREAQVKLAENEKQLQALTEELRQTNQHLTYRNQDLDTFVYKASHDLKAPLSNLEGLLGLLTERVNPPEPINPPERTDQTGGLDAKTVTLLRMMQDSLARFGQKIDELAQTAKDQHNAGPTDEPVNLALIVADVQLDLREAIAQSGADIQTQLSGCQVLFPRPNLKSVVYNLLSNAIKYRCPQRRLRMELFCKETGQQVIFIVKDNGLGIVPEDLPKLFTRYQRLHDHVEGTGVGLYLVKQMVENEGGRIEVESVLGEGTTFRVCFRKVT